MNKAHLYRWYLGVRSTTTAVTRGYVQTTSHPSCVSAWHAQFSFTCRMRRSALGREAIGHEAAFKRELRCLVSGLRCSLVGRYL